MHDLFPGCYAIARIDEAACIGCALCIKACPTDAIVGAAKLMHTVITERCTGCGLCVPPCPVDCIAMRPAARSWTNADAARAQAHASAREARIAAGPRTHRTQIATSTSSETEPIESLRQRRRAAIDAALARARLRRAPRTVAGA